MTDSVPAATVDRSSESFFQVLKSKQMGALWATQAAETARPDVPYPPKLWRGAEIDELMSWACDLVKPGPDAERRVLSLSNPQGGTLTAAVQMVLPGEVAPSHRHTPAAIRFITKRQRRGDRYQRRALPHVPG
jgi:gentisate 1,2-dioxygenase